MDFLMGTLSARLKSEFRPAAARIVELLAARGPLTTHALAEIMGAERKSHIRCVLNTMQQLGTIICFEFKGLDSKKYQRWRLSPETEVALGTYPVVSQLVTESTEPRGLHDWQMENHQAFRGASSPWAANPPGLVFNGVAPSADDMPMPTLQRTVSTAPTPSDNDEAMPADPGFSLDRISAPDPRVKEAMRTFKTYIPPLSLRLGAEATREPDAYDIHSGQCMNVLPFCSDRPGAIGCVLSNFWNHRYSDPTDKMWCAELHFQFIKVSRYARNSVVSFLVLQEMLSLEPADPIPIGHEGWEANWLHNQGLCKKIKALAGAKCPHGDLDLDKQRWDNDSFEVMRCVLARKFRHTFDDGRTNPLALYLCATGNRWLIEAAYYDSVWGIGLTSGEHYPESKSTERPVLRLKLDGTEEWNVQPVDWPGQNSLGKALMAQRTGLFALCPQYLLSPLVIPSSLSPGA